MTIREIIDREADPSLPPWVSVRFWLTILGLAVSVAALVMVTGCQVGSPCSNHGGVHWTNDKLYQCNDGTWE